MIKTVFIPTPIIVHSGDSHVITGGEWWAVGGVSLVFLLVIIAIVVWVFRSTKK